MKSGMDWPRKCVCMCVSVWPVESCCIGMLRGKIKGVIKELVDRRVKLKLAERLAEGLAQQVKSQLSDKEKRIREQYESQLERYVMTLSC